MTSLGKAVARQVILPEVGSKGQERIESSLARLPEDLGPAARGLFRRYAQGAGQVRGEVLAPPDPRAQALLRAFSHPTSRDVAEGALAALSSIKAALEDQ